MDVHLYALLNSLTGQSAVFDTLVRWGASGLQFVIGLVLVTAWFWPGSPAERGARQRLVVYAVVGAAVGLALAQVVGHVWFRERPYVAHAANLLLLPSPDPSFPSDHAVAAFAIAVPFLVARRPTGWLLLGLAVLLGLCRVVGGIHYPGDVLGGALLGLATGLAVWNLRGLAEPLVAWGLGLACRLRLA